MTDQPLLSKLAVKAGVEFFDYQLDTFKAWEYDAVKNPRACLYYKTGAGKSITALVMVAQAGHSEAVVIAPPITHPTWVAVGEKLGISVDPISHAKFRQPSYQLSRHKAVIADEFHLFGGHSGKGWVKFDRLARHLQAPLILASATPNYNDAERVYCIQHVLDPHSAKGGFTEFLYKHCLTEQDQFSMIPKVLGFHNYPDAAAYLADLPNVYYLPDDLVYAIREIVLPEKILPEMDEFGLDVRRGRIIASGIEEKHARVFLNLVCKDGHIEKEPYEVVRNMLRASGAPLLVFANHSTVALALDKTLSFYRWKVATITGKTPKKKKRRSSPPSKPGCSTS